MIKQTTLRTTTILLIALTLLGAFFPCLTKGENPDFVFSTWDIFEADKLASIWLIKRYINPEAEIKIYPKGTHIKEGIPFDTPEAKFRRYHNASTYAVLMTHYDINDPTCEYISRIIHDIEINTWGVKAMPESDMVNQNILQIIKESSNVDEIMIRGLRVFDQLSK
nr:chromate resistance protein ChrB domain-containing protein [uncultured Desulfobulbus sp.]